MSWREWSLIALILVLAVVWTKHVVVDSVAFAVGVMAGAIYALIRRAR